MENYKIDLQDFMDDMFFALEKCSEGVHGHEVIIKANTQRGAGEILAKKLIRFFSDKFELETEDY